MKPSLVAPHAQLSEIRGGCLSASHSMTWPLPRAATLSECYRMQPGPTCWDCSRGPRPPRWPVAGPECLLRSSHSPSSLWHCGLAWCPCRCEESPHQRSHHSTEPETEQRSGQGTGGWGFKELCSNDSLRLMQFVRPS